MGRKSKVSMQDIANRLNISKNAVSLALQNKKGIGEEMKQRILETAKELGYGKPASASGGNILVLVPERIMSYQDNDHFQFFHDMIWGLERNIRRKGKNAVIVPITSDMESDRRLPQHCKDITYQGMILFGIVDKEYARMVWELDVPLVMLDSFHRELPCPVVTSANMEGAYQAVSLLVRYGHRDIGFIGPTNLTTSHEERWFGYWKAMQEHELPIDTKKVLACSRSFEDTELEIDHFLDGLTSMPSAFFCSNDRIAYLLVRQLRRRRIRIPEDISVVGFDDLAYEDEEGLQMTTMRVEKEKICDAASRLLLSLTGSCRDMMRIYIEPTLVVRDTVREIEKMI